MSRSPPRIFYFIFYLVEKGDEAKSVHTTTKKRFWCDSGGTDNPRTTHGRTTGEPRRTVSGYINICGAPSGEPRGNHGESNWVITPDLMKTYKKKRKCRFAQTVETQNPRQITVPPTVYQKNSSAKKKNANYSLHCKYSFQ